MDDEAVLFHGCAGHVAGVENVQALDDGARLRTKGHVDRQTPARGLAEWVAQQL